MGRSEDFDARPQCAVKYATRRALLALLQQENGRHALYVPTLDKAEVGAEVRLKVSFGDGNKNFHLSGTVQSVRENSGERVGFSLVFPKSEDQRSLASVVAFCARNQEPARRFSTSIACVVCLGEEKAAGVITDLSLTGAFVVAARMQSPVRHGTTLDLELKGGLLGMRPTRLKAQVVWRGEKKGSAGFGAHFVSTSGDQILDLMRKHGVHGR